MLVLAELCRVYEIGVEVCGGTMPTSADPPELRTGRDMIEVCKAMAGIDMVRLYQLDPGHGMRQTLRGQEVYHRTVRDTIDHPVALSVHFVSKTWCGSVPGS